MAALGYALVLEGLAFKEGDCEGKFGGVGREAVAADTGEVEGCGITSVCGRGGGV